MAVKFTVKVGGLSTSTLVDYTSQVPLFDPESGAPLFDAGMQCANGSACQFQFIVHDDVGEIPRADLTKNLASHNQVTISEDAPGYDAWLGRGRIADKGIGRGDVPWGNSRTFAVTVDDGNTDTRGLNFTADWVRPAESGRARVLAALAAFCNTSPRLTTVISTHFVAAGGEVTMPAKTYKAGEELNVVFEDCATVEGKIWSVVIHHLASVSHLCFLYIDEADHTTYASTLSITDTSPNHTTSFPPIWDQGDAATEAGGENPLSTLISRYGAGDSSFVTASQGSVTDRYDYWAGQFNDSQSVSASQASTRAAAILNGRSTEHVSHQVTLKIPAAKVDLLCAGMSIGIRSAASMGGQYLGTTQTRRIGQIKWEQMAPEVGLEDGWYYAHMQLDRPLKVLAERVGLPVGPKAPSGTTTNFICGIVRANLKSSGEASGAFMEKASDCDDATEWGTNGFPVAGQYWVADAGSSQTSERWRIRNSLLASSAATAVTVYGTDDAAKFAAVTGVPGYDFTAAGWTIVSSLTGLATGNNSGTLSGTFRYWAFRATAGGGNGWSVYEFELGLSGYTPASTDSATGSAGTTNSGLYAPSDHDHGHGVIASGDLHTEYVREAVLIAKGDIFAASAASTPARLAVGTNNQILTADSAQATGVKWAAPEIDALSDVAITSATEGDELRYRSGLWVNRPGLHHAHIIGEPFTGDGVTTTFTLANEASADEVAAYVAGSRTDATLGSINDQITFAAAPANGAAIRVDYVPVSA